MQIPNAAPRLLFRFQEETLAVSPPASLEVMRHQAMLHVSIINISAEDFILSEETGFSMELSLSIGEGGGSLFTPRDQNGWGIILCPDGFTSTMWNYPPLKKSRISCTIFPKSGKTVTLKPGLSLTFTWDRIVSTAPEGYATLQSAILGLNDAGENEKLILSDSIFKKQAETRIRQLSASPSTGAPGQEITLSWSIENADSGLLLPGGYDILGPKPQSSSSRNVILDERIDRFYLNLVGNGSGVFQDVNVFLMPPRIVEFYLDHKKNICWGVHFSSNVQLIQKPGAKSGSPVSFQANSSGTLPLKEGTEEILLRCEGLYRLERKLVVPPVPEFQYLYGEFLTYPNHQTVRLCWKTAGLASLSVYAWDTDSYVLSSEKEGCWEQAYPAGLYLTYGFCYETAGGEKNILYIRNEVTSHEMG
ncbi:hypothetical protein [Clostridium transplantifaecale]|uniref:hypothetical protein n=1 Tax=Clostridium transplantifaecale TaxID=2479838 RepID=UPI000F62E039|nr:hypothetical protein [Clostridium transplantifaecale]